MGAGFGTLLGQVIVPTALTVAGRKAGQVVAEAVEPAQQPTPPVAPQAAPAPEAPAPVQDNQSKEAPVVDLEAAQVRARKRRAESESLFNLTKAEDTSVVITKSLLGE